MIIYGKTPKDWREWFCSTSLYHREYIVGFIVGFIIGIIIYLQKNFRNTSNCKKLKGSHHVDNTSSY